MTALVVITSLFTGATSEFALGHMAPDAYVAATNGAEAIVSKTNAMQLSLSTLFGSAGNIFVAVCLFFFAFSTIIGWNFFGKINVQYLFKNSKVATLIYSIIAIVFIFLGSLLSNNLVWELTDFFNYLMVIPNVLALIALGSIVAACAKTNKKDK